MAVFGVKMVSWKIDCGGGRSSLAVDAAGLATSWSLISVEAELVCGGPVRSGLV
jgi:hypothetical protein